MAKDRDILVANVSAAFVHEGRSLMIVRGRTTVRAGHPIVRGREHMFSPLRVDFDVEQATAAPEEKRNLTVRRTRTRAVTPIEPPALPTHVAAPPPAPEA